MWFMHGVTRPGGPPPGQNLLTKGPILDFSSKPRFSPLQIKRQNVGGHTCSQGNSYNYFLKIISKRNPRPAGLIPFVELLC